ncbi:pyridoxal-phosphate dependent enzyme [Chelativorans sp. Marseille-P2723]|uniref:threonine ammonia-lyase n=1 Tax=Chelativorans sp. Marseille-P2723 TaxID=2709133 RepID=UPI001FEDD95D|nr:pyridoxal-phosphate dependent enzyme [Chelativorans sp. Marseille-P2723]
MHTAPTSAMTLPTYNDVLAAHERIGPYIHRTPVLTSTFMNERTGADLYFKCENFQKAGAFKARGAVNAVFSLPEAAAAKGVATHSSGNHALSLCYAAARRGIPARVVMPATAPSAKKAAVLSYGGQIVECAPSMAAREAAAARIIDETDADLVHPYDDPRVIAGQATAARELAEDIADLDAFIAPISGGGLISGCCLALSALSPMTAIYAAEPDNAADAHESLKVGRIVRKEAGETVADGLKACLSERTWHFVSRHVADILTVTEAEIIEAMRLVWGRMKIVIEPSSAVPVAALLKNPSIFAGKRVGILISGGNVDLDRLPWQ